jgi:flagellar basal-body rod modification protein FlgD
MALGSVGGVSSADTRMDSLGLDLQSLLRIVLTQLTYQDPLKPVDNFQFMSQLAQFTSLEQTRQLAEKVDNLLVVQASNQAVGLLGRQVDLIAAQGSVAESGTVRSVSFSTGQPLLSIQTADGRVLNDISPSQIGQVR